MTGTGTIVTYGYQTPYQVMSSFFSFPCDYYLHSNPCTYYIHSSHCTKFTLTRESALLRLLKFLFLIFVPHCYIKCSSYLR